MSAALKGADKKVRKSIPNINKYTSAAASLLESGMLKNIEQR